MSILPFGFNSGATPPLSTTPLLMPTAPLTGQPPPQHNSGQQVTSLSTSVSTSCCENGRPIITDPHTGQSVCSCQYGSGLLSAYSRVQGLGDNMYTSPHYASQGYLPMNADTSAFYSPLNAAHYDTLKDNSAADAWRGITQPTACYPYDPTMTPYPYPNTYGGMDLNGAARRKNATRETTNTLKAWLYEHRKNPYPTKGEKIMLAIITKMTLTQVSTWFANARRRLKKENKMTWSPRNRCGDDDDDDDDGEKNDDSDDGNGEKKDTSKLNNDRKDSADDNKMVSPDNNSQFHKDLKPMKPMFAGSPDDRLGLDKLDTGLSMTPPPLKPQATLVGDLNLNSDLKRLGSPCSNSSDSGLSDINGSMSTNGSASDQNDPLRPRIWSIAHVATSTAGGALGMLQPQMMEPMKDQNANLTTLKPPHNQQMCMSTPSYTSTGNAMRPWLDSSFNVTSSLFSPMSGSSYGSLGPQRARDSPTSMMNQSLSSLNGLSSPSLSRPYPSLSSLYTPARDLSKRNLDTMTDLRS